MKKYQFISLMLIPCLIFANLISTIQVSAQEPITFGEIKAMGAVQIESSTGQWVKMQDVYPLLKNTKLRTKDGIVYIIARDGSRIELSNETEASIDALNGGYTINLIKGTLSFNVAPSTPLTVTTRQANVSVIKQTGGSLVAGVGAPTLTNIQGTVFCSDKGTFIKSISGKINVSPYGLQAKILNTGESLFASLESKNNPIAADPVKNTKLIQGLIAGTFLIAGTITAFEAFRSGGRVASPSGF
jgi:hypothetical protein